ncbi:hypothetical protein DL766_005570 [Monosporascus sp. MC13-8B]|uniref:aldehyde dehydrogenase (NAD(+)) n=1 Tax=Monosporascus cannonballus TaxID=155416 RepID=A0ABY0GV77_9PEZI|nr:hypothetical protein DL762_009938 [Monosporascus cannonballus]RYO76505.1 hypothetical protein DL763_010429 [Monosporascus cannonballus]RYP29043.1 hypothetical protein DL766_005570 [Monosporascus sp. MC13-8B]
MTLKQATTGGTHLDFTRFCNVIDGNLVGSSKSRCSVNPSTLEENPQVPVSTNDDVNKAVDAAKRAAEKWGEVPWSERQQAIERFADALEAVSESFARMLIKENGKPFGLAQYEISYAVKSLRGPCELSLEETVIKATEERRAIVSTAVAKFGPALLTGNAFILKPSPFTPYCGLKLAELGQQFFPPGVLQALSGDDDLGPWLTEHPGVDKVSFTGSTATGKRVLQSCSKTVKRVTLELGGNDPAIVCDDVDPQVVAPKIAMAALLNSGQGCIAIKRVFIHEAIYGRLLTAMAEFVKTLKVGDGFEEDTMIGPITNSAQFDRVRGLLADISDNQLKLAYDSTESSPGGKGFFVSPTIVDNPPDESRIVVEEPFGLVFPLVKWSEEDEVIKRANDTEYGLGASVWTNDPAQAQRFLKKLKAGTIWVNSHAELHPRVAFAGHKQSGLGTEQGIEGLKAYCNFERKLPINMNRIRSFLPRNKTDEPEYEPLNDESQSHEGRLSSHNVADGVLPFSWVEYGIFTLLGVAMLWAWNMFLAAAPYFQRRFQEDDWALQNFQPAILSVSTITNLVAMLILTNIQYSASYPFRINSALYINVIVFALLTLSTCTFLDASPSAYLSYVLCMVALTSWAAGLIQNGAFAFASSFGRPEYMQAIMAGQGVAGVLPPLVQVISVLVAPPEDALQGTYEDEATPEIGIAAFIYFLTAVIISIIAIVAFIPLVQRHNRIVENRMMDRMAASMTSVEEAECAARRVVSMPTLFRKLHWLAGGVFMCFVVAMFFPVFTPKILSVTPPKEASGLLQPAAFIPLGFFFWNLGDLGGRYSTLLLPYTGRPAVLFAISIARLMFLPLYGLCNLHGAGAVINSDIFYLVVVQFLFGLTNGWLASNCMMAAGEWVEEGEREASGSFMGLSLVAGLAFGSLLSFTAAGI